MRKFEYVRRVLLEKKTELVPLPHRATQDSAGYDIYTPVKVVLKPGEAIELLAGFKIYLEKRDVFLVMPRSSYGRRGLMFTTTIGVIDADYVDNPDNEGEVHLFLKNMGDETIVIERGDRVAQGLIIKYKVTDDDAAGGKRKGGVGSTGVR